MRQELIAEQIVLGQSDPELKKYLWVAIRTQKDKKLQTLIEVCTDFSSLVTPTHLHRPAEQSFAVHQQTESYTAEDGDLEDVFAVGDRPSWTNRTSPDPAPSPTLQQMFALARRMEYEMRPVARQPDAQRQPPGNRSFPDQNRGFRSQARTGRDYSRIKCFSCGEFGHMQSHCPRPDTSLPFRPPCWQLKSDNRPQRDGNNHQGNLTHTGLCVLHSTPMSSSCITSTPTSHTPDTTIIPTKLHPISCTETCASTMVQDCEESQEVHWPTRIGCRINLER